MCEDKEDYGQLLVLKFKVYWLHTVQNCIADIQIFKLEHDKNNKIGNEIEQSI